MYDAAQYLEYKLPFRNGNKQIVFYQSGVGSEADFEADPAKETITLRMSLGPVSSMTSG